MAKVTDVAEALHAQSQAATVTPGHNPGRTNGRSGVQLLPTRQIRIVGVPLDLGQLRRGVDMGPSAVRVAGLQARLEALGHHVDDAGNVPVAIAETKSVGEENARYLKEIRDTCVSAADVVVKSLEEGRTPVVLGWRSFGCRRYCLGSVGVLSSAKPAHRIDLDGRALRHQHAGDVAER